MIGPRACLSCGNDRVSMRAHYCPTETTMTTPDDFLAVNDVPRDRYGRPLILTAAGKRAAYTRCTTFVGCLEDTYNLSKWQQRMVALGLAARPDLLLAASSHTAENKAELNDVCEQALEAAGASAKATTGTALHKICERLDRGETVTLPKAVQADIAAYQEATQGARWTAIERLMVHDGLKIAGTPDRLGYLPGSGRVQVADLKTGSIEFGVAKIAMQLAVYAHSEHYNPETGERTPVDVDLDRAIVIHLPAGEGRCELVEVDIAAGWEGVQIAREVRAWRARKGLARPRTATAAEIPGLLAQVITAATVDDLLALYRENRHEWNDEINAAAAARKQALVAA